MQRHNVFVWLGVLSRPTLPAFSVLFMLEPLARSVIITVIPLMALQRFGSAQNVSLFFFILGIVGVGLSLVVPWLISRVHRRGTFGIGAVAGVAAMSLFVYGETWALCLGMAVHLFAAACLDVSLNLYLMEHVRRKELGRFEPIRVFFLAFAWSLGPFLGVLLRNTVSESAPFIFGGATTLALAGYFFYLRFTDHPAVSGARRAVTSPLTYLPRFFRQPRLRLAYLLSFMRAGWWTMYFIYVPIYCVTSGLGETLGGALVSLATALVMTTPLWRKPIQRFGIRYVLYFGFFGAGLMTIFTSQIMDMPHLALGFMVLGAFFAVPVDAVGNVPFFRAVHPWERSEMATVFGSYRAVGALSFPGMYSGVLAIFQLPAVFAVTGVCMIATGLVARYIPKRMN